MGYVSIPVRSDLPSYKFQIELERVIYGLSFSYNSRESRWFMDILDSMGNPLVTGIKLLTAWAIASRFQSSELPPGEFFLLDTAGENKDPTRDDLGSRILMIYRESTT